MSKERNVNKRPSTSKKTNTVKKKRAVKETSKSPQATAKRAEAFVNRLRRWGKVALWGLAGLVVLLLVSYFAMLGYGNHVLNENLDRIEMAESTLFFDANGQEIGRMYSENREVVEYEELPRALLQAFVAVEDKRFYQHPGIDVRAISRAFYRNVIQWSKAEGGSTITQQLAKMIYLSGEKKWSRKIVEMTLAIALETRFTKNEILTMYVNRINFGSGAYGVKAAALVYFGKEDLKQLTIDEMALLAGIPKAPSHYNPLSQPERALIRRNLVLQLMHEQGMITADAYASAVAATYSPPPASEQRFGPYLDYVIREAEEWVQLDSEQLYRDGYRIYTWLDTQAQSVLEQSFADDSLFPQDGTERRAEAAFVMIDHESGGIVALDGSREYVRRGLNRALVPRQPGSTIKPLAVFAPALAQGEWHPYSKLTDEPLAFGEYQPRNYDRKYEGEVTMSEALRVSKNVPAVWLLERIGLDASLQFLADLGIELPASDRTLALALGGLTHGVTPLDIAEAYATFATGGIWRQGHAIREVRDSEGNVVYSAQFEAHRVLSEADAYYMTRMLEEVVHSGTGKEAALDKIAVAGKTGSTQVAVSGVADGQGYRDSWFAGYTPQRTAAVWVGFDQTDVNHYMRDNSGYASRLFQRVFSELGQQGQGEQQLAFTKPEGVRELLPPPQQLSGLRVEYRQFDRSVEVNWWAAPGGYQYRIYRKKNTEDAYELAAETTVNQWTDTEVERGLRYKYRVEAYEPYLGLAGPSSVEVTVEIPQRFSIWDLFF